MELLRSLANILLSYIDSMGYLGIFLGMLIESSLIPFPSELVLIPAGVLVMQGKMNGIICLTFATLGSVSGAILNYFFAMYAGRGFVYKVKKYFLISDKLFEKAERFFEKHGAISTFVCRLLPGIRQVVSLFAGFAKMDFKLFTIFTAVGAGMWSGILIYSVRFVSAGQKGGLALTLIPIAISIVVITAYVIISKKLIASGKINPQKVDVKYGNKVK